MKPISLTIFAACCLTAAECAIANPYEYVGREHNRALEALGVQNSFAGLDKRLTLTHMLQTTSEHLCENGITQNKTDKNCIQQYAGFSTEVLNDLRYAIYPEGGTDQIVKGYIDAFSKKGNFNAVQLRELENLYRLLPNEDNIDDLYYLSERIEEFDRYIATQLSQQEAEPVLLGSAVMKASLEYWLLQLHTTSNWISNETNTQEARRKWLRKALKLIAADAAGCALGSPGGPLGCVAGGVALSAGTASTF